MFKRKKPLASEHVVQFHHPAKATSRKHIIAIASGKGGVGKSTVANNLAVGLAKQGYRVGLIDADIYGASQSGLFGIGNEKTRMTDDGNIIPLMSQGVELVSTNMLLTDDSPIIWRAPMVTKLIRDFLSRVQWARELDYLLIDLPPGTGDIQITLAQQANLSGAIVVTTPQEVAFKIAEKAIQMFHKVNIPILGLVENMSGFVCEHCQHENHIFKSGGAEILAKKYQTTVLAQIPLDKEIVECGDNGTSILESASPAALAYRQLIENIPALLQVIEKDMQEPLSIDRQLESLSLTWPDGMQKTISAHQLRLSCACALCIDEITGSPLLNPDRIPGDISLEALHRVGRYGVKIDFSDGHNTGIFTFEKLKHLEVCEAPQVKEQLVKAEPLDEARVRHVLNDYLNPQVSKHGGKIELIRVEDTRVFVKMLGGCQGCSQANVTLKQGVLKLLKQHFPSVTDVIDVTDHGQGVNPYY